MVLRRHPPPERFFFSWCFRRQADEIFAPMTTTTLLTAGVEPLDKCDASPSKQLTHTIDGHIQAVCSLLTVLAVVIIIWGVLRCIVLALMAREMGSRRTLL